MSKEIRLRGTPICWGVAIGVPYIYRPIQEALPNFTVRTDQVEGEIERYRGAIRESEKELKKLKGKLEEEGASEGAAILDSHLEMMKDPSLTAEVEEEIRSTKRNTEQVFQKAITEYTNKFERIEDPFFKERVGDLHDVAHRILKRLHSTRNHSLLDVPKHAIIFAEQLTPSEAAEAQSPRIGAFVTRTGGETAHAAIIAKAKGIPYVSRIDYDQVERHIDKPLIVDGRTGEVILNPSPETLEHYQLLKKELDGQDAEFKQLGLYAAETVDGYQVSLSANAEMAHEVELIEQYGGDGIGLFRSEYICLSKDEFPTEEDQYQQYKHVVETLKDRACVIRTFDIGGDKFRHLTGVKDEENPFLGCRAIRFMLKENETFCAQLRAILRASAHGDVRILFPMISGLPELLEAKQYLEQAKEELRVKNIPFDEGIRIGCMIEVPSAAITADILAKECDFFSIGTNDLVQYSVAVDRDNHGLSYLYTPAHPAILRLIRTVVREGARQGIKVSICGEMAADPHYTALLLGLGVQELSVSARYLPLIKNAIRSTSVTKATRLATHVLDLRTPEEVLETLANYYQESALLKT